MTSPWNTRLPLGLYWDYIVNTDLKYYPVYLYLSVAVASDKYCIYGWVQRPQKINYYMSKICHAEPGNLANWPAEIGKIWSRKLRSTVIYRDQFSVANFSKFRRPVCQILRLTANFPHIVINFLWPLNATKYAAFIAGNCNWQIQSVYQINRQYFR